MAFDEALAERLRDLLQKYPDVEERKMFGGLCFLIGGNMCCGIVGDRLMARVGPANYDICLRKKHAREMNFTGKPSKGMVYVQPEGIEEDAELASWLDVCMKFAGALPPKYNPRKVQDSEFFGMKSNKNKTTKKTMDRLRGNRLKI